VVCPATMKGRKGKWPCLFCKRRKKLKKRGKVGRLKKQFCEGKKRKGFHSSFEVRGKIQEECFAVNVITEEKGKEGKKRHNSMLR